MELVDVYDENGIPTGKVIDKDRKEPLMDGEYILAVGIWIVDEENRILLTKRSMQKSWAPGKWENTAGHVKAGESCVHAILRELREETGLEIAEEELTLLGSARSGHYFGKNYGVRVPGKRTVVTFQEGETCDAKWVEFPEFMEMGKRGELSPSVLSHLQDYKENFLRFIGRPGDDSL